MSGFVGTPKSISLDRRKISAVIYLLEHGDRSTDRSNAGLLVAIQYVMNNTITDLAPSNLDILITQAAAY